MKTLKLNVYLWCDKLPAGADCWDTGVIYIPSEHRKLPGKGTIFNDPDGLGAALHRELKAAGLSASSVKEKWNECNAEFDRLELR